MKRRSALIAGGAIAAAVGGLIWAWPLIAGPAVPPVPELPADMPNAKFAAAAGDARRAVLDDPRSAAAWGKLGMYLHAHGRAIEQAVTCYRTAAALDPTDGRWAYLAAHFVRRNDPAAAVPLYEASLKGRFRTPDHKSTAKMALAETFVELGKTDDAEALFRQVRTDDPDSPRGAFRSAIAAIERGDDEAALPLLEGLTDNPLVRQRATAALAGIYRRKGDAEKSARYEQQASALPPESNNWPDPFLTEATSLNRGRQDLLNAIRGLERQKRFDDAIAFARQLVDEYPDSASSLTLGQTLVTAGRPAEAVEVFEAALKEDPGLNRGMSYLAFARYVLGTAEERAGRKDSALKIYEQAAGEFAKATETRNSHNPTYLYQGKCLAKLGRWEDAIRAVEQYIELQPTDVEGHLTLGDILFWSGRKDDAVRAGERAAAAAPADPRPKQAIERWKQKP